MYMTTSTIATAASMNGMGGPGMVDGSGTIDPAALNNTGKFLSTEHPSLQSLDSRASIYPHGDTIAVPYMCHSLQIH